MTHLKKKKKMSHVPSMYHAAVFVLLNMFHVSL